MVLESCRLTWACGAIELLKIGCMVHSAHTHACKSSLLNTHLSRILWLYDYLGWLGIPLQFVASRPSSHLSKFTKRRNMNCGQSLEEMSQVLHLLSSVLHQQTIAKVIFHLYRLTLGTGRGQALICHPTHGQTLFHLFELCWLLFREPRAAAMEFGHCFSGFGILRTINVLLLDHSQCLQRQWRQ